MQLKNLILIGPMKPLIGSFVIGLLLLGEAVGNAAVPDGLDAIYRLDQLPVFKDSIRIGSVSSYDRTGGNDDGFSGKYSYVRKDADGLVLADLSGPGIIHRIWTPTPSDDILEFLFDGETKPRVEIKFRELFLGNHPMFPRPVSGFGAGGYYCYMPLPYAKSCTVRIRAPKTQFYQINYSTYPPGAPIKTFSTDPTPDYKNQLRQAAELLNKAGTDISSYSTPPGAEIQKVQNKIVLESGATKTVFQADKGGRILGLNLSPSSVIAGKGRDLWLTITFDKGIPAVQGPLGDFFGYGWGEPSMKGLLIGTSGENNYCYFPMPFDESAKIEITSFRSGKVELSAEVITSPVPRKENEGRFYGVWRRENPTTIGTPFTFLETAGRGHLVGVILQSQGFESGKTLFFEGDDQTIIDGELAVHGTGSEDFFNGGWYDVPDRWEKRISFPLSGCLGYAKHLGRTGAYRFFLGDAYVFRKSIRQTIEHAGEKNNILTDYCGFTFLYADRNPWTNTAKPQPADLKVIDLDECIFPMGWQTPIYAWSFDRASLARKRQKIDSEEIRYISMTATGTDWFGQHFISPICEVPSEGEYSIYIEALKGPDQAMVQLFQNEKPVAGPVDLYAEKAAKSGRIKLGSLRLNEGKNNLMIKLVDKNKLSSGLGLDLVQVICVRDQAK